MHTILSCSPIPSYLPLAEAEDIKVCPRCSAFIMKINDGSCNRMNCTVCGCLFCWLCLREISDVHFLRSVQGHGLGGSPGPRLEALTGAGGLWGCPGPGLGALTGAGGLEWGQPGPAPGLAGWSVLLGLARLGLAVGVPSEAPGAQGWGNLAPCSPVGPWVSPGVGPGCAGLCLPLAEVLAQSHSVPTAPLAAPSGGRGPGHGPGGPSGSWAWCWEHPWSSPLPRVLLSLLLPLGSPSTWVGRYWQAVLDSLWSCYLLSLAAHGPQPGQTRSAPCSSPHISVPPRAPSAHSCATPDSPQSLLAGTFCCPPAAPASVGVLSLGSGVRVGERRKGSRGAFQEHLCCGSSAGVAAWPWGEGGVAVAGALPGWEEAVSLELCQGLCRALQEPFTFLSFP